MDLDEQAKFLLIAIDRCIQAGRIEEGIRTSYTLLDSHPNLSDAWYNLAYLQRCSRLFEEAVESYRSALRFGAKKAEQIHLNIAFIFSEHLDMTDAAKSELQRAIEVQPQFLKAWLNLGNLHEDLGELSEARAAYENALAVSPDSGRALGRLAILDIFQGVPSLRIDALRELATSDRATASDAAEAGFALGQVLDASARYDDAFEAFTEANEAAREANDDQPPYDSLEQERLVNALICNFRSIQHTDPITTPNPPIFICGMFRSGSTLTEQILARHSRVTAGGELEFIPAAISAYLQPYPDRMSSNSDARIKQAREAYLNDLDRLYPERDIITDKRPDNFLHIGLIKRMFPSAKIIHTVRNPLDTILSVYFGNFDGSISYGTDLEHITDWYLKYQRLMTHWKSLYCADIFDADYDAIVSAPETSIRSLLDFCNLDWEESCLGEQAESRVMRTLSSWQVRQPLHRRSSGRWRNYAKHMEVIQILLDAR